MEKEYIRNFYGRVLGTIETDMRGNRIARDFYGKVVATYNKQSNKTQDFYGRVISTGDTTAAQIPTNYD